MYINLTAEPCEWNYETLGSIDDEAEGSGELDFKDAGLSKHKSCCYKSSKIGFHKKWEQTKPLKCSAKANKGKPI